MYIYIPWKSSPLIKMSAASRPFLSLKRYVVNQDRTCWTSTLMIFGAICVHVFNQDHIGHLETFEMDNK